MTWLVAVAVWIAVAIPLGKLVGRWLARAARAQEPWPPVRGFERIGPDDLTILARALGRPHRTARRTR